MDEEYKKPRHYKERCAHRIVSNKFRERYNGHQYDCVSRGMNIESNRIGSFKTNLWPSNLKGLIFRLANAGFYFNGSDDEVKCFSCSIVLRDWQQGDSPKGRHKSSNPTCRFVKGIDVRNIPDINYALSHNESNVPPLRHQNGFNEERNLDILLIQNDRTVTDTKQEKDVVITDTASKWQNYESNRLKTFKEFPLACPVDPYELSAAGFYLIDKHTIQCFACFLKIRNSTWKVGDRPMEKHIIFSPSCPFVKGLQTNNRRLTKEDKVKALSYDIHQTPKLEKPVRHPKFRSRDARMASFKCWEYSNIVKPHQLVEAGFFYSGRKDLVICFCCGCRLEDWQIGDVAWKEHKVWSPDCDWLKEEFSPCMGHST